MEASVFLLLPRVEFKCKDSANVKAIFKALNAKDWLLVCTSIFFKAITLIYVQLFFNTQKNMLEELLFQMLFAQLATS